MNTFYAFFIGVVFSINSFITAPDALNRQLQAEIKTEIMRG